MAAMKLNRWAVAAAAVVVLAGQALAQSLPTQQSTPVEPSSTRRRARSLTSSATWM